MATAAQLEALLREPDRVLEIVGHVAMARARRCFSDQRAPDGTPWPPRYPGQDSDPLNVAGALADLASGPRIKPRRYDQRPAGRDTGDLLGRLTFQVAGGELQVGSDVPYAERFHAGGESTQVIDTTIRRNLAQLLRTKRRAAKRRMRDFPGVRITPTVEQRRLGPVFSTRYWTTTSPARPFVGLNDTDGAEIGAEITRAAGKVRP